MDNQNETPDENQDSKESKHLEYDYAAVLNPVRIAVYDDGHSIPRMVVVQPADTATFIENLSQTIYNEARNAGGSLPYMAIREVSENFIHARFAEATVSILDRGNTVRFTDQGPGIPDKERAQQPGFTRAVEAMKPYIRGVGSGLPIVREYMELSRGYVTIEDNLGTGSVVTISLASAGDASPNVPLPSDSSSPQPMPYGGYPSQSQQVMNVPQQGYAPQTFPAAPAPAFGQVGQNQAAPYYQPAQQASPQGYAHPYPATSSPRPPMPYPQQQGEFSVAVPDLTSREIDVLVQLYQYGPMRGTDMQQHLGLAGSSVNAAFGKLESKGLVQKHDDKRRSLTEIGSSIAAQAV